MTRSLSRLLRTLFCLAGLLLPVSSLAASVTYQLSAGSITTVQFIDLTTGQASPCPIGGTNCLTAPVALTGGELTVDEATGTLVSMALSSTNTGVLQMGGFNGYSTVSFSNLSFASGGASALQSNGSVGSVNQYAFGPVNGTVTTDLGVIPLSGPAASVPGASFSAGPSGSLFIDQAGLMTMSLSGVNLGVFCNPLSQSSCVLVKADFGFAGTPAIPEPGAIGLYALGLALVAAALRRAGA